MLAIMTILLMYTTFQELRRLIFNYVRCLWCALNDTGVVFDDMIFDF